MIFVMFMLRYLGYDPNFGIMAKEDLTYSGGWHFSTGIFECAINQSGNCFHLKSLVSLYINYF